MAIKIALVYPYFHPANDNSIFRFPPLGLGYIAASLKKHSFEVDLVDCTFMQFNETVERIKNAQPQIIGFYSMFSMKKTTFQLVEAIKSACERDYGLFAVGGPLPSWSPESFLDVFDLVAVGEGEETMVEVADCFSRGSGFSGVKGLIYKEGKQIIHTPERNLIEDLDNLAFPSRELFNNDAYKRYYKERFGYTTSAMISSRGCPFSCDFCSRPIFGSKVRTRSVENIVDEIEQISALGYERIWFSDDCFTLNSKHLLSVCDEMVRRKVDIG